MLLEPVVAHSNGKNVCWNAILSSVEVDEIAREPKFKYEHQLRKFNENFGVDENKKARADKAFVVGSLVALLQVIQNQYTAGKFEFFLHASLGV